ncbi:MAG: hypothetical protein WAU44_09560 [Nitrospira sp.]|uniref:hypothetical protein n=1 Tax=Nitrospira sp. ND1 TaxID=1658518 RepID=UPI0009C8CA5B|nr:hypothetical protein [Nitrospira sp. ND1]MBK7418957.1 hypothetical protein [Nitrospira sp.]MBK7485512.1 hypothetical protein [Nitrospira sp.]MBK9997831.1 hypothetical protein [Nitrospira sp.]MBP6200985.1 hypothetical protein [Nitrospira sp.]MBP6207053.1 hypothetical protein [Nitrospira sp.]
MSRRYELAIARGSFPIRGERIRCNARRMKNKPAQRRVTHLKEKAQRAYREYRAIYVLSNGLDDSGYEQMNLSLENIPNLSKAALRVFYSDLQRRLASIKEWIGAKGDLSAYDEILQMASDQPGKILWVPKWYMQEHLFSRYEKACPLFVKLPPHGRIGIDINGVSKCGGREVPWTVLEARLFEDMGLLWNAACDAKKARHKKDTKESTKREEALLRATVRSAFFLLEGYLNALSWDIQKLKGSALTKDEKIWLSEWDEQTERQRTLGLRDKLHKYPKIAIGKQYPPLLETNCPELKFIVESEEELRHSLVHPKVETHIEVERQLAPRESRLYMLEHGSCERLMDSAISLIRKIGEVVGDRYGDVNIWLHDRNSEGGFSAEAFE